ncbi:MAG: S-layer homology domain-containing protein [Bacillota bacterium]
MKKIPILIILAVLILCTQMTVPVNATGLPDKWEAPSSLILADGSVPNEEFALKLTYNKGAELSKYLSLKIADQLAQYGYSCGNAVLQVDWTIDSTTDGWKYHENWDVIKHGGGHGLTNWEYYAIGLTPTTTERTNILRLLHEDDWRWKDPVQGIGQFLEGKTYTIETGFGKTAHFIDLTQHTVYVRARFVTMVQDAQYNRSYVLSDWSDIVAIGKDADSLPKRLESLETPVLSNLHITDEIANGAPVAAFNLSNPQQVKDASAYAASKYERCIVRCEVSVNNGPWIEITLANSDIKDGVYKAPLFQAAPQADENTHLRLRAFYSYHSHLGAELFRSDYSNIIEFGAPAWGKASSWAAPELKKAVEYGLIPDILKGADMTKPITREEFCELALLLYEKTTGKTSAPASPNPFTDTKNPQILKAFALGITKGTSATTFSPGNTITRQECATMLYRTIRLINPGADYSISGVPDFPDQKDIASWAVEGTKYMSKLGIIKGDARGYFMPRATTTAQQAAGYGTATREAAVLMSVRTYEVMPSTSSVPAPVQSGVNFSGNWSVTAPGTGEAVCIMSFSQSGSAVTGTFTDDNQHSSGMSGTVSGRILTIMIDNPFFEGCKFVLTMDAGNNSFTGEWITPKGSYNVVGKRAT